MPDRAPGATGAETECRRLCRYLVGGSPPPAIVDTYIRALETVAPDLGQAARIDRLLSRAAQSSRLGLALADAYAGRFRRSTPLRQHLTLLCAILESSPPYHGRITGRSFTTPRVALFRVGAALLRHGLLLLTAVLIFGPVHVAGGGQPVPHTS